MRLRLLAAALLVGTLLAVAPTPAEAGATCAGVGNGSDCTGVYAYCDSGRCKLLDEYFCVGVYDGTCTGVQKP